METNHKSGGRHGSGKLKDGPPGPVPFQGIGTRLRRSRSKDHSNEFDNLSTTTAPIEIANLRQHSVSRDNAYHDHPFGYLAKGGTLERPKRLYSFTNAIESSAFMQQQLYGTRNLYEESRLLGHQYEEPHLIMDRG